MVLSFFLNFFRDLHLMLNEMYVMGFYLADPRDDLSGMDVARKV